MDLVIAENIDLEGEEDKLLLVQALKKMPKEQVVILWLRNAGYTQQGVSHIMGLKKAAVVLTEKAAMEELRRLLWVTTDV